MCGGVVVDVVRVGFVVVDCVFGDDYVDVVWWWESVIGL